jgi:hypothetical protein
VLTAAPASASYGQSDALTAKVSLPTGNTAAPAGTVDFSDGGAAIPGCSGMALDASGNAVCTASSLAAGTHALRADYHGDGNTNASFATLQYSVGNATTSMTLTASPNPAVVGQTVVLTATVSSSAPAGAAPVAVAAAAALALPTAGVPAATPTGTVQFFDGTTSLGSVALDGNGVATLTLPPSAPGSHALSATYAGGAGFASASAQVTLVVNAPPVAAPALSTWMLMLLAAMLAAVGFRFARNA